MARIKRAFGLREWTDWDTGKVYEAIDKAVVNGQYYLLVKDSYEYGIYKMVSEIISESVKLSTKKLLYYRNVFENPEIWSKKSKLKISDTGVLSKLQKPPSRSSKVVFRINDAY